MLFDGPADLPTATLRSRAKAARHRVIAADLSSWLATRWRWLRPRTVPLLVAFVGMLAVLGATKYLTAYAGGDQKVPAAVHGARTQASSYAQLRARYDDIDLFCAHDPAELEALRGRR
jgi:hypothetical protein